MPVAKNIPTPRPAAAPAAAKPSAASSCETPADDKIRTWCANVAQLTETIRLTPNDPKPYRDRAFVYSLLHDPDRAIADYSVAIELDPGNCEYWMERAGLYREKGDPKRAIADYSKALEIDPACYVMNGGYIHNVRGLAYAELGKYDLAITDYDEAIRINPKYAWAYYNRGLAYEAQGNLDKAIADYDNAIRVGGGDIAHCYRGLALKTQGKKTEAIDALRKCIDVLDSGWGNNPEGPGVRKSAESALKELGAQ